MRGPPGPCSGRAGLRPAGGPRPGPAALRLCKAGPAAGGGGGRPGEGVAAKGRAGPAGGPRASGSGSCHLGPGGEPRRSEMPHPERLSRASPACRESARCAPQPGALAQGHVGLLLPRARILCVSCGSKLTEGARQLTFFSHENIKFPKLRQLVTK